MRPPPLNVVLSVIPYPCFRKLKKREPPANMSEKIKKKRAIRKGASGVPIESITDRRIRSIAPTPPTR